MSRAKWKGPYIETKTIDKKIVAKRNCEITLNNVNHLLWVHDGKTLNKVEVTENMVGHKLGEFVKTRAEFTFKKKKKKR